MKYFRQSTASQELVLPRFLDSTDGNTEETGLTIANTDIKIWKPGATELVNKNSGGATHIANGLYYITLDATDTDTIGSGTIHVHVAGALDVQSEFTVLSQAVYDSMFGSTALSTLAAGAAMTLTTGEREAVVDGVWDEVLTAATHNVASSSGRRVRQLASIVIYDGILVSATANTATLGAGASSSDGAYDPAILAIVGGTGSGQSRLVLQYAGASRLATVDRDWKTVPDATSEYVLIATEGREHVNEGAAQGGGASTVTLNAQASASDDAYIGQTIFLRSGTGEDQARRVSDYNGSTKVATVDRPWDTIPAAGTGYVMLPSAVISQVVYDVKAKTDNLPADPADESALEAAIATRAAPGDAMALDTGEAALVASAVWGATVGPSTAQNILKAITAAVLAKTAGGGTGAITIRNIADSAALVSATVDETTGDRLTVTVTWGNA